MDKAEYESIMSAPMPESEAAAPEEDQHGKVKTGPLRTIGNKVNQFTGKLPQKYWDFQPVDNLRECIKAAKNLRAFTHRGNIESFDPAASTTSTTPLHTLPSQSKSARTKPAKLIPASAIASAKGIAIFALFRAAFVVTGGQQASGMVVKRLPDGSWSAPAGVFIWGTSAGLLIGAELSDVVVLLRTEEAVKEFFESKTQLGYKSLATASGPMDDDKVTPELEAKPVWTYARSKGLYGGLSIGGAQMEPRKHENARFYGREITVEEILGGAVPWPDLPGARALKYTLELAEGRGGGGGDGEGAKNEEQYGTTTTGTAMTMEQEVAQ